VPFELKPGESVGSGVRRIVDEQLAEALDELRPSKPAKADETVHAARKRFKRIRAMVRLVRDELGDEAFAHENASFRDTGASLAEARDAAVLVQTLGRLKPRLDPEAFAAARKLLLARRRLISRRVLKDGSGLESVARAAEQARDRVAAWQIDHDGWRALRPGLMRIYREGRRAYKLARPGAHPDLFHEWRKQVKNLWHQLEVLEPIWPEVMKKLADECHELADALGRDHDLAVLRAVLEAEASTPAGEPSPLLQAIDSDRSGLQLTARSLGARIFAEKPKAFVGRLAKYWKAWQADHAKDATPEAEPDASAGPTEDSPGVEAGGGGMAETGAAAQAVSAAPSDNGHA
jgi:CHAD domain-containing protein